jgi:hypothetical protein
MKSSTSIISIFFALLCLSVATTSAFVVRPSAIASTTTSSVVSSTSLNVFGKKKSKAQKAEEAEKAAKYWEGEWVCKDCGYIYNRVSEYMNLLVL